MAFIKGEENVHFDHFIYLPHWYSRQRAISLLSHNTKSAVKSVQTDYLGV